MELTGKKGPHELSSVIIMLQLTFHIKSLPL